ncbi:MAG: molybdopterin-dependent oxidoreductase [Pseudomonadota bacterium]
MSNKIHGLTSSHWGVGIGSSLDGTLVEVSNHPDDPNPSPINGNIVSSLNGEARVLRPSFRRGWLKHGFGNPDNTRGKEPFVEVPWDEALDLIAHEIKRVKSQHGNRSIFAGSYGWSSAGRFHHAQSQLKRFLNSQGGSISSWGNYSYNAALILMPYIVGEFRTHVAQATRWTVIAEHSDLVVMFGGMAERSTQVSDGGLAKHRVVGNLNLCREAGVEFINISPHKNDALDSLDAEWLAPLPGSDTAVMMGIAHTLLENNLQDQEFLDRYTVGFEKFRQYLTGETDGVAKSADWAESKSTIPSERIRKLAFQMANARTMISTAASLQRTDYGEQPLWMTVTLAAMLGQIGLPGGGYGIGYGVNGNIGNMERLFHWGNFPQLKNAVEEVLPVAMISEMLLNPGKDYEYNGSKGTFPDARLVWWAGGNPFHHHQDLNRLHKAFQTPETIIINEINWTSTARHADIVLPVAAAQEREDFGGGRSDNALIPMPKLANPPAEARVEFEIYEDLAVRLSNRQAFTEGLSKNEWLKKMWEQTCKNAESAGVALPTWEQFIQGDIVTVPDPSPNQVFLKEFRTDPEQFPLPTPSGKIEIFCEKIASYDLSDCPGHPTFFPPRDVSAGLGEKYPLYLLSGQPLTRLHSQLDNGDFSKSYKIKEREPVLIHPDDAAQRNVKDGDVVELFNDRGRCLAGAKVTKDIKRGCVFLWTGAWFDPDFNAPQNRDRHGNPNVLTQDQRTSSLAQGPASHSTLVNFKKLEGTPPPVQIHKQPPFTTRNEIDRG